MGGTYNRPKALKQLFFDVFVGAKTGKLHWTTFVSGSGWGSVRYSRWSSAGWVRQCGVGGAVQGGWGSALRTHCRYT